MKAPQRGAFVFLENRYQAPVGHEQIEGGTQSPAFRHDSAEAALESGLDVSQSSRRARAVRSRRAGNPKVTPDALDEHDVPDDPTGEVTTVRGAGQGLQGDPAPPPLLVMIDRIVGTTEESA
jgi:hypothetical protein